MRPGLLRTCLFTLALGLVALLVAGPVYAQARGVCPPFVGGVALRCQVDEPPRPLPTRPVPYYRVREVVPDSGARVRVTFVVDVTGVATVESGAIPMNGRISGFHSLVREAYVGRTFTPALRGGQPVAARMEEEIIFEPASPRQPPGRPLLLGTSTAADGALLTTFGFLRRDTTTLSAFTDEDLAAAQHVALLVLGQQPRAPLTKGDPVLCVAKLTRAGARIPPDPSTLQLLAGPGRAVVGSPQCPPTFEDWGPPRDSLGRVLIRPQGWTDPLRLLITSVSPWTATVLLVQAECWQGMHGDVFRCRVERAGAGWQATCLNVGVVFS